MRVSQPIWSTAIPKTTGKNIIGSSMLSTTPFTTLHESESLHRAVKSTALIFLVECLRAIVKSDMMVLKTYAPPEQDAYFQRSFEVSLEIAHEAGLKILAFDPKSLAIMTAAAPSR